ncbi:MAG: ABC transporter permease [Bacteroidales bacterium]|nr:ABC transporter permease [Bacteroidales bacterium]
MIKNFFLTAFRNAFKNWTYSIINILGLSTGLAAITYIFLFIQFEIGYDGIHDKAEQIYRVGVSGKMMNSDLDMVVTPAPMAEAMLNDYPEVINSCRIMGYGDWLIVCDGKKINERELLFADSTFFDVFSFKLLKGNPKKALSSPRSVVLTETGAQKYFGKENPIGKLLKVESDTVLYKVTGLVEDPPENSHFHFDLLGSLSTLRMSRSTAWLSHNFHTYLVLKEGTDAKKFEHKMQEMVVKNVGPEIEQALGISMDGFEEKGNSFRYFIQPMVDIHLHSDYPYELEMNGNVTYVYIFISIAIFILIIASINFTNLSTARASNRSKEVGVRKVVGAMKPQLVIQFLTESFLITLVSLGIAIVLLEVFMPWLNNIVQIPLEINYFDCWYIVPSLFLLIVIVALMAGSYPAFFLASFKPVSVLTGKLKLGAKSTKLRAVLVIIQFVVSVFILLSTYVVSSQLSYVLNKDMGFDKENVLLIRRSDALDNQLEAFKSELKSLSGVVTVSNSTSYPGRDFWKNLFLLKGESKSKTYLLHQALVGYDYENVFGFEMAAGRFFSPEYADSNSIVINEAAVKILGLEDPVGKIILQPTGDGFDEMSIIGVVKDFNFRSLHNSIEPLAFTFMGENIGGFITVKIESANVSSSINKIQSIWNDFVLDYPFEYSFLDEKQAELYKSERRTSNIFILFSGLSILIAFMGLLGLISFMTEQRKKEIGVRKTFGATSTHIIYIICKDILKLVFVAAIISLPLTYWGMNNWLQSFSYRINIDYFMFVMIIFATLVLSLLTVIYQTIKAALRNPAETLRYE